MSGPYGPPPGVTQQGPPSGPPQGWSPAPTGPPRAPVALDKMLSLAVGVLGVVIVLVGLLDATSARSSVAFVLVFGWASALFLIAGLLAFGAVLPKAGSTSFAAAAVSVSAFLALLLALFGVTGAGPGFIVTLIIGFIQAAAAVTGYLLAAGLIKIPPKPQSYSGYGSPQGAPQGYGPPQGYPGQGPQGGYGGQQAPPQGYGPPQGGPQGYGPQAGPAAQPQGAPYTPPTGGQPSQSYPGSPGQ